MASRTNGSSAPADPSSSDNPSALIEQLSEELSFQQAVLVSLLESPDFASTGEQIADVKAEIAHLKRKLAEARSIVPRSGRGRAGDSSASTPPTNPHSMGSSSAEEFRSNPGMSSRKRSIGSSHLDVDASTRGIAKSRRTTPSPPQGYSGSSFDEFGDDEYQDVDIPVIDLTGDDDAEFLSSIRRQREAEERLRRRKAEADRDAAIARQLAGRASPSRNESSFPRSWQPGQNNAFDRILGRCSPASAPSWNSACTDHIKQESRSSFACQTGGEHPPGHSTVKSEPRENQYWMPGAYVDSDDESNERFPPSLGTPSQPSRPSLPPISSLTPISYDAAYSAPILPPLSRAVTRPPPCGFGTNVPAIELARQSSMARQETPAAWPPVGPIGHMLQTTGQNARPYLNDFSSASAANRPGFITNGSYHPQTGPSTEPSSLAATINRVNGYDFNAMVDADGNPLSSRLMDFLDDYVNDPRKTEEDIQQLLSNIRPDMEIPEEERGETPEAMKYSLFPHQQLALKWMTDMEMGTNKGGILADDMGLGKTISTLALMVSRPSPDRNVKTNLIIGPVALIKQWEQEVKKKLKGTHKMSVYLLHQKRTAYSELKKYDVVLTTYGSLASEWKRYNQHVDQRKESAQYREEADMELARKCPLLHRGSRFYRIILDEAQCIKNKETQGSQAAHHLLATYRWCLTGTPMMNNVSELYPLIRFLKIRPYCDFKMFQKDFRSLAPRSNVSDYSRDNAMRKLHAVLKAIMLRRMKNSMIDGKPILQLPPKTENEEHVTFSDDEQQFYRDLESRSQVLFNKYLRAGTVGKNYSNILVLLLRLRQACCHPHLMEFESVNTATSDTQMVDLAKELEPTVVERIKAIEAFECPICYDGVDDPILIIPCGHDTCQECFTSLTETSAQNNIRSGNENGTAKCPVCRGQVLPTKVINLTAFRKVHMPEALPPDEAAAEDEDETTDSDDASSDDDTESDTESLGSLADFVVPDDEVGQRIKNEDPDDNDDNDDDAILNDELAVAAAEVKEEKKAKKAKKLTKKAKRSRKTDGKGKAKSEPEEVDPRMLKKLRIEAGKNKDARRRYMHYLRDNWEDSAKVTQVIELLRQIQETDEKTIIFSQWTALLDLIECQIKYKLNLRYCRYTGSSMSRNQRDEAVQDFTENPRTKVMLVSLRAGNAGLNLTAASRIIICDPFWNPYIEMQAVDRAHRIGQQREVQVHRILVKETVEDRILALQEKKRTLVEAALDEGQSKNVGRLSERELAYLFGVNVPGGGSVVPVRR